MKVLQVRICGFRGFRDLIEISIAPEFTVIDGRNGVGKSTIFDAIEFSLTGQITKYGDARSGGETVENYLWWKGEGSPPKDRFVEVTFHDGTRAITLRRTPTEEPSPDDLQKVEAGMVNTQIAPRQPLPQLCAATIIRDEMIAALSLDLSETERYAKLRQAIGATDADVWTKRASNLLSTAKKRNETARQEETEAQTAVAQQNRRIDEVRASIAPDDSIVTAANTMISLLGLGKTAADELVSPTREFVASKERLIRDLSLLLSRWDSFRQSSQDLINLQDQIVIVKNALSLAETERSAVQDPDAFLTSAPSEELISELHELRNLGMKIGLLGESCPLCSAEHSNESFAQGLRQSLRKIEEIDAKASQAAAKVAEQREKMLSAEKKVAGIQNELTALNNKTAELELAVRDAHNVLASCSLPFDAERSAVEEKLSSSEKELKQAKSAWSVLSTLQQNTQLQVSMSRLSDAEIRLSRAQEKAGKSRRAEAIASALHDAARRAASETLDLRLDRVLPLMAELYNRLRPHPVWQDIEYSIRGDLRRFLSLQVGDGLNPQFLFSSGQRRATGLAFLLSINLSLAWSRWRTILLDDPVQHVDDFRAVNLAEVLAQLVSSGRQVIIAVEDSALAELLSRRMPVSAQGSATHITLGLGPNGSSAIVEQRDPVPLAANVLAA